MQSIRVEPPAPVFGRIGALLEPPVADDWGIPKPIATFRGRSRQQPRRDQPPAPLAPRARTRRVLPRHRHVGEKLSPGCGYWLLMSNLKEPADRPTGPVAQNGLPQPRGEHGLLSSQAELGGVQQNMKQGGKPWQ